MSWWWARAPDGPRSRHEAADTASRPTSCVCDDVQGPWRSARAQGSDWDDGRGAERSTGGSGSVAGAESGPGVVDDADNRAGARAMAPE